MDIEKLELEAAQKLCELIYKPGAWNGLDDVDQRLYRRDARAVLTIALAAAAEVAKGPYASTSKYDDRSVYYGSDLNPDRSEFGRGKQAGREAASSILRTVAIQLGAANG